MYNVVHYLHGGADSTHILDGSHDSESNLPEKCAFLVGVQHFYGYCTTVESIVLSVTLSDVLANVIFAKMCVSI